MTDKDLVDLAIQFLMKSISRPTEFAETTRQRES